NDRKDIARTCIDSVRVGQWGSTAPLFQDRWKSRNQTALICTKCSGHQNRVFIKPSEGGYPTRNYKPSRHEIAPLNVKLPELLILRSSDRKRNHAHGVVWSTTY